MYSEVISNQGFVNNYGAIIYKPTGNRTGYIKNIKFYNTTDSAWNLSLFRGSSTNPNKVPLYAFQLDSGDIVNDSEEYLLKAGDYLYAISDLADKVIFMVNGNEVSNDANK